MNKRQRAYKTLLVAAVNAGIQNGSIDLDSTDDFEPVEFTFVLPNGVLCVTCIEGDRFGEITIDVWVNPDRLLAPAPDRSECYVFRTGMVGKRNVGCCATAHGWLERKAGKWIQDTGGGVSTSVFQITNAMKARISELDVEPLGFEVKGRFYL